MSIQFSVLDRLMNGSKKGLQRDIDRATGPASQKETIKRVKENLLRDLDALLNTRQTASPPPRDLEQVHRSLMLYGLPDFSTERNPERIASLIKSAIDRFEPRLRVVVRPVTGSDPTVTSNMRFRISGSIRLRPNPEPVTYDTVIEIGSGQCRIEGGGSA